MNTVIVYDFWAPWCGKCTMIKPQFDKLKEEYPNIAFSAINILENEELAKQFNIMNLPSFVVVTNNIVELVTTNFDELKTYLEKYK